MKNETVYLVIVPGHVDAARVRGGRIVSSHRVDLAGVRWDELWSSDLAPLEEAIEQIVRVLRVGPGAEAVVAYSAPRSTVEVFSVPGRGAEAVRAATLSLKEAMSAGEFCTLGTHVLWATKAGTGGRSMVLCAGEADATPEAIWGLLDRAGLRARAIVPTRAVGIQSCWRRASARNAGDAVLIDMDDDCTTMVGVVDNEPRLVRQFGLGISLFVEAYERAIRATRAETVAPPTREEASQAFWSHGVPSREVVLDREGNTRGEDVLPLLQPIVQRLAIEIKQTLRFGLDLDGRRLPIRLVGRGASIPSLASLLTDHADAPIDVEPDEVKGAPPWSTASCVERVVNAMGEINLLPRSVVERAGVRMVRRAAFIGAGVAAIALVAESVFLMRSITEARTDLEAARPQLAALMEQVSTRDDTVRLGRTIRETEERLAASMGHTASWLGVLGTIERCAGGGVHLSDIVCGHEQGTAVATLRGFSDAADDSSESLRSFVAELGAAPDVERVSLGSTRLQEFEGRPARSFTVVVYLRDARAMASVTGGSQ